MIQNKEFLMMFRLSSPELYNEISELFTDIKDPDGNIMLGYNEFLGLIRDDTPNVDDDLHGFQYEGQRYFAVTIYWQKFRNQYKYEDAQFPWIVSLVCDQAHRSGFMIRRFKTREDALAELGPIESLDNPYRAGFMRL